MSRFHSEHLRTMAKIAGDKTDVVAHEEGSPELSVAVHRVEEAIYRAAFHICSAIEEAAREAELRL